MDDMNNENDNDIIGYLARDLTTDSVLSEGSVSRESIASISNKLINMELELDQTLRDLDTTNHQSRSKSPAASKRQQTRQSGRSNFRRRSGSIDPLASSRRSGSIDPGNAADNANKIREMSERLESLEKENHLLETKYDQQRKRLNLAKRENDDLRSTLDSAISEIDKLGEEAQAAHNNGDSNGKLTQETQETIKELQLALTDAHTEITQLRIQKSRTSKSSSRSNNNSSTNLLEFPSLDDTTGPTLAIENQDSSNVSLPPPPPPPIPIPNMMSELGCSLMITVTELNHLEFLGIDSIENDISFKISYGNENRYSKKISLFDSSSSSSDTLGLSALIQEITPHMFALIHDHGETPIKLEIMHSDDVIGEVTLTLPELKLEDMNLCLELEEYLPLTSTLFQPPPPSSSSLTLTSSSNRSFIKLSLCMMNFKKLPRHFSELESYRKNLSEISLLAKNETCSKTCIDVITKAIQSMNIEMEQNKIKIDEYEKKQQQQQPEEEEDSTKGEEDSTAGVFSPGSSTSTLSSIAHFQGEVPTTPLLIGAEEDNNSHSMIKSGGGGEGSNMVEQMSFSSSALRDQTIHEEDSVSSHDLSPTFPRKTTSVAVVSQSCQTTSIEPNLSPPSKTTVTSVATDPMPPVHGVDVATSTPAMKTSTPVPSSSSTATATSSTPSSTKEQVIEYIIEQPLHAFVIVLVIILILWNGSSNIIHNAQMERMESKYALIKSDYLNSCDILGEEMMIKHNGVNSGSDNRLTLSNTISNLNINYQNCTSNIKLYENISLNYDTCTSELLNEKEISEQLLLEINKNNKYNSNHQNNEEDDEDGSGGWFFSKTSNKINENENMITLQDKKEDEDNDDDENALNGKSSIQTIAALYRCRKENHELNEIKVNSLISLESSTQSLHQCQQELSRISTAHISSNNEYSTCEESLLKQQTWSASLSATNNVLHSQLKDSNLLYNKCSNDLIINKEESLKHQSLIKTINLARNISNNKILKLEEINIKLENSTATLNASSQVLQSQLLLLTQENDNLIDKTTNLTSVVLSISIFVSYIFTYSCFFSFPFTISTLFVIYFCLCVLCYYQIST